MADASTQPTTVDKPRIERAVREILAAVGEDPNRDGLRETPARVARMYEELFGGLHHDPREDLRKFFAETHDNIVVIKKAYTATPLLFSKKDSQKIDLRGQLFPWLFNPRGSPRVSRRSGEGPF